MVGVSTVVAIGCSAAPWFFGRMSRRPLGIALVVGISLAATGALLEFAPYPWTNLDVLLVALSGGILVGRAVPAKPLPLFVLLIILSALDTVQIALTSQAAAPGAQNGPGPAGMSYGTFYLVLPWGPTYVGVGDLLLAATMAEHWRRRRTAWPISLVPAPIGLAFGDVFSFVIGSSNLPLIPFLTAGWLFSEGLHRARRRQGEKGTAPAPNGFPRIHE